MLRRAGRAGATRRRFIAGVGSLSALSIGGWVRAAGNGQPFLTLSARLTGFPVEALDPAVADDLLDALRASGDGAGLELLLRDPGSGTQDALARRIIAAWYSGIHPTAAGPAVRTFGEALVWRALDFTTPPGYCAAAPEDWSRPPPGRTVMS